LRQLMAICHRFLRSCPPVLSKAFAVSCPLRQEKTLSAAVIFLIFGCPADKMNFPRVPKWWNLVDTPS
jgi:hypothetical protein